MIESLRNIFAGGWNTDSDKRLVRPNQFTDAQDVEFISDEEGSLNSIGPVRSMEHKFDIPAVSTGFCVVRLEWKYTGGFIETRVFDANGNMIASPTNFAGATYSDYITNLNTSLSAYGVQVASIATPQVYNGITYISARFSVLPYTGISDLKDFSVTQIVDNIPTKCPVLQYASQGDTLIELTSATIDNKAFVISAGSLFGEVGVYENGTYTSVYRSKKTVFSKDNVIDLRVEKTSDGRYALYFTDFNLKPKVLYVQSTISDLCTHKYTLANFGVGTSGYIVLGFEDKQTNLQLIDNSIFISFKSQLQSGGYVKSGGWRYVVRAGINGSNDTTNWSFPTPNVTPVFDTSIDSPNAFFNVQGKPGLTTSKVNVLTIEGLNKYVYNFIEVAALYYVGTTIAAPSATIIGRYDITANTMDVHHIGNEIGTNLDIADIPQYDDVIEQVENLEIKKNRINLSNVTIAADENLTSLFSGVTIATGLTQLDMSGGLKSTDETFLTLDIMPPYDGTTTSTNNLIINTTGLGTFRYIQWRGGLDPYLAYATGPSGFFVWPSQVSAGVIRCNWTYRILPIDRSDWFIDFELRVYKIPSGTTTRELVWSNSEYTDRSNDDTSYSRIINIEGGPGDKFEFGYLVHDYSLTGKWSPSCNIVFTYLKEDIQSIHVGEYLSPENCSNKVGYMLNESYPFFARAHYKNGYISSPYYIGTHKFAFNAATINSNKIFTDSPTGTSVPGMAGLLAQQSVYAYFADISNIPIAALRDTVDYISIWRGECNPTVLGSGVILAADSINGGKSFTAGLYPSKFTSGSFYPKGATDDDRKFGIFISPDTSLNKTKYSGGKIITLGSPRVMSNNYNILGRQDGNSSKFGSYAEYFGNSNKNGATEFNILAGNYVNFASESQPLYNSTNNKKLVFNGDYQGSAHGSMAGVAVTLDGYLLKNTGDAADDNGIYIAQYIVETENQYDIQNVRIVPTGAKIRLDDYPTASYASVQVFGGDTYTQKNYVRLCSWTKGVSSIYPFKATAGIDENSIFSSFIGYYGQARFNAQLTYNNGVDTPTFTLQGQKSVYDYLFPFQKIEDVVEEQFNYDAGYSAPDTLSRTIAYNSKNIQPSKFISRIYFSDKKPVAAISDTYRKIKPNAYRDLDTKNGPIHGLIDQGDHMIALQPYAVTPLVYNTDAFVSTTIGGVQTTAGDVYPLNQVPVSTFGPSTKSAVLKGLNRNGNVTTYWVSDWASKMLRYGYDGVSILSDNFYIRSYLLKYMSKTNENNDIVMGYRPRNQQVYVSFKQAGQSNKITIGWNEASNIFTGRYSFEPFRFSTHNDYLLSNNRSGSVYSVATGEDYLKWYGSSTVNGLFVMEPVFNKMPEITKRAFAFALNVGEDSLNFPTATVYSNQYSSTTSNFEHRRGELVATSLANGNNDIMGQWINLRIESNSYINLLAVNLKVGYKRRLI